MQKRPKKINQKLKKNIEKLQAEIFNDQDNIMQDIKVSFNDVMQQLDSQEVQDKANETLQNMTQTQKDVSIFEQRLVNSNDHYNKFMTRTNSPILGGSKRFSGLKHTVQLPKEFIEMEETNIATNGEKEVCLETLSNFKNNIQAKQNSNIPDSPRPISKQESNNNSSPFINAIQRA